jgi:hypothetical protein
MGAHDIMGLLIAIIAVTGGLGIGVYAIYMGMIGSKEEKIAQIEARNKERLALIEKGLDPSLSDKKTGAGSSHSALLWGLLLSGVGLGAFIGYVIAHNNDWSLNIIVHATAFLFGGIGLIIYYVLRQRVGSKKAD